MAKMSKVRRSSLLGLVALILSAPLSAAQSEEFLCDATQASTNELPVLDKSCPIGKGLWGNQTPRAQQSSFWIQCGMLTKPMPLATAARLYQHLSVDVWGKPEKQGFRCLIGPYEDFAQAKRELAAVKRVPGYQEAFIREVAKGAPVKAMSANPPSVKSKPVTRVAAAKPAQAAKPVANKPAPAAKPAPASKASSKNEISIRLQTQIAGTTYSVPYLMFSDEQFYMEHGLPWNRLSYERALQTCRKIGMRLPGETQWQTLLDTKVMEKKQWPIHLPYWGAERKGLFTSGKVNQLSGSSLLNVMCVK